MEIHAICSGFKSRPMAFPCMQEQANMMSSGAPTEQEKQTEGFRRATLSNASGVMQTCIPCAMSMYRNCHT